MPKIFKHQRRNLNEAFIALSDDEENLTSDESTSISGTASNTAKKKNTKLSQDDMPDRFRKGSSSTDYLVRNSNLQTPREIDPKNNKLRPKQCVTLKRSESLSGHNESQNKSKNVRFSKTRRSLESKNSPLEDISKVETPVFSRTLRRNQLENFSEVATPKLSKSERSSHKERLVKAMNCHKIKSRVSYPGCEPVKLNPQRQTQYNLTRNSVLENNTDIGIPDAFGPFASQTTRNFTGWRRVERSPLNSFPNLDNVAQNDRQYEISSPDDNLGENTFFHFCNKAATNDIERNTNYHIASSNPNSVSALPCCKFVPIIQKVLNREVDFFETQELWIQNDLSANPNCRHTRLVQIHNNELRENHLNQLHVLGKVNKFQEYLKSHSKTKQNYYGRKKVDLVKFECEARNEVKRNELNSASETQTYNIKGTNESPQQMNLNIVATDISPDNEFIPEANAPLQSSPSFGSPNRQINLFPEAKTPESPISALMNKNLSELHVSKIINRIRLSQ